MLLDVRPDHLKMVQDILQRFVPDREVWAFGSRAKWLAKEYSDLDLCILGETPLSFSTLGLLEEAFDESDLPYKVDVVDWATTSSSFQQIIQRDKVVVQTVGRVSPSADVSKNIGERDVELRCANPTYGVDWQPTTLGRICEAQGGAIQTGPFGSQLHTSDYQESGIPVVMPTNIGDGGIIENGIARIGHADVARLSQHKLRLGDIVFSRRGDVTKNALIRPHEVGWLCGTGCLKVRLNDESIANAKFISHCLRLPQIKEWLVRHAVGATMPNLNTGILSDVPIHLPPLKVQLDIAETLGALDDRIALLRETNATLEGIAQALFKSWFVDFDPVHAKQQGIAPAGMDDATAALFPNGFEESELGLVPRGWNASTMDEVSIVGIGKTPPRKEPQWFSENVADVRWVSIRDMGISGAFISQTSEYLTAESIERFNVRLVPNNTVLLSFKMTIGRVALTDGEMTTNEAIAHFKLDSQSPLTSEFIYLYLKQFDYARLSSTSSIADAVNSKTVKAIPILVPNSAVVRAFQDTICPIFERIKLIQQQAQTLATLRDTLLPRLISGQLRLSAATLDEAIA